VPTVIALAAAAADGGSAELARRLGRLGPVVLLAAEHAGLPEGVAFVKAAQAGLPDGVAFVKADLTSPDEAEAAWRSAKALHGPPDVLVTLPAELPAARVPMVAVDDPLWAATIRDNLLVAANTARAAARSMCARRQGRIAMVTWRLDDAAGRVAHAAACGAVRHLARTLAAEVGEHGVTVNAVSVTPGRAVDAAAAIRLLCSPDGGFLTSEALWPMGAPGPAGAAGPAGAPAP
jgi:NAD(P)-dependent dehydrogenase (short-subunit alcohol dehydrogenase family)